MGLLVDLSDNAAADGSAGHPTPDDRAVCIGPDSACSEDSECDTATSIGCSAGVCMPPSLNACASGGVPGQATAGTACDANETGSNNGFCISTTDTDGDGSADAVTQCLVACTPDGAPAPVQLRVQSAWTLPMLIQPTGSQARASSFACLHPRSGGVKAFCCLTHPSLQERMHARPVLFGSGAMVALGPGQGKAMHRTFKISLTSGR